MLDWDNVKKLEEVLDERDKRSHYCHQWGGGDDTMLPHVWDSFLSSNTAPASNNRDKGEVVGGGTSDHFLTTLLHLIEL